MTHLAGTLSVSVALALSGCAVGPDFARPSLPREATFSGVAQADQVATAPVSGTAQVLRADQQVSAAWWQLFESAELTALVDEALRASPDVEAARAALRNAQQLLAASRAGLLPTATAGASATRQKSADEGSGSQIMNVSSASVTVAYAPDLWGGTRRQIEAAAAQAEYERFQLEGAYMTLAANVVNTAISLASIREQIEATDEIIRIQSEQLALARTRQRLGSASNADVLAQEAALASTRASLPALQKLLYQARSQLTAYLGRFPNEQPAEQFRLSSLKLPRELPLSLPSSLVEQRPDVRAAEALLHQASASIGVATANRLPQINLTASLGSSTSNVGDLFSAGTGVWSLVGSVSQSLFDAGALKHRQKAAVAAYDESAARYRGTVIGAFQDVSNTLNALQVDADALEQQRAAETASLASLQLTQTQYRLGAVSYVNLLTAQQSYQSALSARVKAEAARYSDTVALFQSLGGGWWNRSQPGTATSGNSATESTNP